MDIQEEIAQRLHEQDCGCGEDPAGRHVNMAAALMPLVKRARAEALREAQSLIAADGFFCPSLDARIEQGETDDR